MGEDCVAPPRNTQAGELRRLRAEPGNLNPAQVVHAAFVVEVEADTGRSRADPSFDLRVFETELLPLARHARRVLQTVVAAVAASHEEHVEILELRTLDRQRRRVQRDRLHQCELLSASARSDFRRRHAELFAERPRERLVRVVASVDGDTENVCRSICQSSRRLGKSAATHIAHDRQSGGCAECP